ncbi:MFS transporter [Tistrella sp. BH-R2-4]|uniref:MFS transporter n=1 Tax=Tistrella arctica TaxID=3133430 RepID=A0ABU9YMJ6_9PROT
MSASSGTPPTSHSRASQPAAIPRRALWLLAAALAVIGAGQAIQVSVIPALIAATGLDAGTLGLLVALGVAPFLVGAPLWGRVSDRLGRRPVLMIGLAGASAGHAVFAAAADLLARGMIDHDTAIAVMVVSRLMFGLAGSAIYPVGQAWAADLAGPDRRLAAAGALAAGLSAGRLGGPALALGLLLIGPVAPLWGLAGIGAAAAVTVAVGLGGAAAAAGRASRSANAEPPPPAPVPARGFTARRIRLAPFVVAGVGSFAMGLMQFIFGLHAMARLDMAADTASRLVAITMAVAAVAMLVVQTRLLPRLSGRPAATATAWRVALVLMPVSIAIGWWGAGWGAFLASAVLTGSAMAVIVAALFAKITADPRNRGARAGLLNSAQTGGYALGSAIGGLYPAGEMLPFGVALVVLIAAMLTGWRGLFGRPPAPATPHPAAP